MLLLCASALALPESLEALAYRYGTDKSRDDHNYVAVYSALLSPMRATLRNLTELGIASGQSVQLWHDFFPNAHIWGIDPMVSTHHQHPRLRHTSEQLHKHFAGVDRVHLFDASAYSAESPARLGIAPATMDVVIDDAQHDQQSIETALAIWWPTVRPGGYYVVEDLQWSGQKREPLLLDLLETAARPETREILEGHHAFYIDTAIGHRNWSHWAQMTGRQFVRSRHLHNSHLLVVQRRQTDDARPYQPNKAAVEQHAMGLGWMRMQGSRGERPAAGGGDLLR